uniref:Uncharacterized protein n=1 Tax=Oryza punctata TaxID=4537 RepID=A0A0E0L3I2_ORYPU
MELKCDGGRESSLVAGRWRGIGGEATCRRGLAGGSAESDMHSLARESRTTGEGLAFGPAMASLRASLSPWDVAAFSILSGLAGGSAESDMHSLARESRTTGEGLAFGPAMASLRASLSPWDVAAFSILS